MTRVIYSVLCTIALLGTPAGGEEFVVEARNLASRSENVAPEYPQFGNLTLCVGQNGRMAWAVEAAGGPRYVHFLYSSGEPRPCKLSINHKPQPDEVLAQPTGGFMPSNLAWKSYGPFDLIAGRNLVQISTAGFMPHLKGVAISTGDEPPSRSVFADSAKAIPAERLKSRIDSLRKAVTYLQEEYGDAYPGAPEYLAKIDAVERLLSGNDAEQPSTRDELADRLETLERRALVIDNPLLACGKLLFVKRQTYQSSHYYTEYIDGCRYFGGNLCVLSLADGSVTELVGQLSDGIFGRFDPAFDGRKVLFDHKAAPGEGFRIWEVSTDGTGLRQVTFPPSDEAARIDKYWHRDSAFLKSRQADYRHHTDDLHPCYLPDGGICFVSSRCERGILCDGADVLTATTLYRMDADGQNMEVLSDSPVSEASPSVMNDGRILYTRWEYVDKADVVIKCLWAMWPDGTRSVEIFGNDITFPSTLVHGRSVPGRNDLLAVIGAPHMPMSVGTVIRLDLRHPIRTRQPMTYITPDVDVRSEFGWVHRREGSWVSDTHGPLYTDATPLDEKFFLVSANIDRDCYDVAAYGLYLIDEFGNRVLIHREEQTSCWQPMPLESRQSPPILPSSLLRKGATAGLSSRAGRKLPKDTAGQASSGTPTAQGQDLQSATVIMSDVYADLSEVPRGTIKYLRVMETVPRPWAARHFWDGDTRYQQHAVISMNTHIHVKRLHGIVPVEADGSAYFRVPADKNIFFQALDENFMEVQRMRTFVDFRPGETRTCIGCHEPRHRAPPDKSILALTRPPHDPAPQPGETAPRPLYFPADVQPILDRHCVECHNAEKPEGDLDLSGEMTELFSRSYESIVGKNLVSVVRENDPKTGDARPIAPYSLGSHASPLIKLIREGHEDARLSRYEFITLVTWVDANAPYYGSYYGRRNIKYKGHPDFRPLPDMK